MEALQELPAQELPAQELSAQDPSANYQLATKAGAKIKYSVTSHTVARGETVAQILEARGVEPTPRAFGFVLDANRNIRDVHSVPAGTVLRTPQPYEVRNSSSLVGLGPAVEADVAKTADRLDEKATYFSMDTCCDTNKASFRAYADALRGTIGPDEGITPEAMAQWNSNGEAILELANSNRRESQTEALHLAKESTDGLIKARELARQGKSTAFEIQFAGRNPPKDRYPVTCRVRYALWAHAYLGRVPESKAIDALKSDCSAGVAQVQAMIPYGFWAEWMERNQWVRSRIKRVQVDFATQTSIDIPMQPYD